MQTHTMQNRWRSERNAPLRGARFLANWSLLFVLSACATAPASEGPSKEETPPAAAERFSVSAESLAASDVGVPECDQFLAKYASCVASMPEGERYQFERTLLATRGTWVQVASAEANRSGLVATCAQAQGQAQAALAAYDCAW